VKPPLAFVSVDSVVPDGWCTIVTRAPATGRPSPPNTNPEMLLVVSCAMAAGVADIARTPAPTTAAGAYHIEETAAAGWAERRQSSMGVNGT
jgi:hypothetical protein